MTLNILIGQDDIDLQQAPIETVFAADCAFVDQAENVDLFFSASDNFMLIVVPRSRSSASTRAL